MSIDWPQNSPETSPTSRACASAKRGGDMRIKIAFSVCGAAFALGMAQARADGLTPGGPIIGIFSDPIYSGFVTHDPTISSPPVYFDNSATAPLSLSIVNSTDPTLAG